MVIIPTPQPISLHSPAPIATPRPAIATPAPSHPQSGDVYVDGQGVVRTIYYAGGSIVVSCAPSSTCRVELPAGSAVSGVLNPTPAWHVTPDNDGATPMVLVVPDPGAPDAGIVVQSKARSFAMRLHLDPAAVNATYGYLFPDHGRVVLPSAKPVEVTSEDDQASAEPFQAPIAPAPCPSGYAMTSQGDPPFWPRRVWIANDGVSIAFSANGVIPVAAVPLSGAPLRSPVDLSRLAMISQAGEIDGQDRVVHVLDCYPTIVLYLGFGRDRRAVVLQARAGGTPQATSSSPANRDQAQQ